MPIMRMDTGITIDRIVGTRGMTITSIRGPVTVVHVLRTTRHLGIEVVAIVPIAAGIKTTMSDARDTGIPIGVRIPGHIGILDPGLLLRLELDRLRGDAKIATWLMNPMLDGTASLQPDKRKDGMAIGLRLGQRRSTSTLDRYHLATMALETETIMHPPTVPVAQLLPARLLQRFERKGWLRCKRMPWITLRPALPR
jgi:hypothetical protein